MRLSSLIPLCVALGGLAACGSSPAPGQSAAPPAPASAAPAAEAYANSRQIMLGLVIPAADVIWGAANEAPADDAAWEKLGATALMIAEAGQLMMTGPRVLDEGTWTAYSQLMVDAALAAARAAGEKDLDALNDAGNTLYDSCDTCHARYMAARQ